MWKVQKLMCCGPHRKSITSVIRQYSQNVWWGQPPNVLTGTVHNARGKTYPIPAEEDYLELRCVHVDLSGPRLESFRERKMLIFFERAVPISPNAW